jgi:DNA polymerase (family 10)
MSEVNSRLAAIFDDIGNYLEFKNENPFKVKAYQKAARTLEGLSFSVDSITPKELLETPGIGKAIGEKIQVFLESGQIPLHEELKAEFPRVCWNC